MSFDLTTHKKSKGTAINLNFQFGAKKVFSDKKKEVFYRELNILLKSGVDFKKALEILAEQSKKPLDKHIILGIKNNITEGKTIYESMMSSGHFSPYEYYSIRIGEETRKLEEVLHELQKYFYSKIQMRRQIISVLTYPAIVLLVTFLVLYFMLTKVVPMFSSVFRQFGSDLPQSTKYIIALSNNSGLFFSIAGLTVVLLIVTHYSLKGTDGYRKAISGMVIKIPFFGSLIKKIYITRFCQSMSLLITSKTSLITSLALTKEMISFYPVEKSIDAIKEDLTRGISLGESFKKHPVYEHKMVSMIEVAEQVNQLDVMFERLCNQYNDEINHQTKMIGVILEPMIIIIIGLVVGIIMISMYAPMFDLSKIIQH
jgi:type IV pilus assembly protein PilC